MKQIAFSVIAALLLASCGSKPQPPKEYSSEQIDEKFSSGVVLIRNVYYYTMSFGEDLDVYFTGVDKEGNPIGITFDPEEIKANTSFGTGFFVDKEGMIATNNHVANPTVDLGDIRSMFLSKLSSLSTQFQTEVNNMNVVMGALVSEIANTSDSYDKRKYTKKLEEIQEERDKKQEFINAVNQLHGSNCTLRCNSSIGVAYNNTYVTNMSDFHDCVVKAGDEAHDLALIQLKDKQTPEKCHVFKVPKGKENNSESDDDKASKKKGKDIKVGTELYMIAYNLGPTLALTKEGVMAQVTSGKVTQNRDESHVMYDISSLHGSSGSPVLNKYGKLVAINFAGIDTTQGFNYGVKVTWLRALMDK